MLVFLKARPLLLALVFVLPLSVLSYANSEDDYKEGFDQESPEKIERARKEIEQTFKDAILPETLTETEKQKILSQYQHLDPKKEVPTDLLERTVLYFEKNKDKFTNQSHITILDFKRPSDKQRFFVINLTSGAVEKYWTTHGHGSDLDRDGLAERFLNVVNSGASSVGFVRVSEVYSGRYKRSLRLDGLSTTNSKIRERAIVLHGWDKVKEKPVIQGLSWGCPTLDWSVKDGVIDKVKEGSLMYIGVAGQP